MSRFGVLPQLLLPWSPLKRICSTNAMVSSPYCQHTSYRIRTIQTCILIPDPIINMSVDIATSNSPSCLKLLFLHIYHSEIAICMILHHCLLVLHLIVHSHLYSGLYCLLVTHPPIHPSVPSSARPCPIHSLPGSVLSREACSTMGDSSCSTSLFICAFLRPTAC
jgi:hypothetical protein